MCILNSLRSQLRRKGEDCAVAGYVYYNYVELETAAS